MPQKLIVAIIYFTILHLLNSYEKQLAKLIALSNLGELLSK